MSQEIFRTCPACGTQNRIPVAHLADQGRCGRCKTPLPPNSEPIEVDPELFEAVIAAAKVPVLVDFWAEWCGPCRAASRHVKTVAAEMAGKAVVLSLDTEQYPALAQRHGVMALPTFVVFRDGKAVFRHVGLVDDREMKRWLEPAGVA